MTHSPSTSTLEELFHDVADVGGAGSTIVRGLTADSRKVAPGFVFAALAGAQTDGARFVPDAVAAGAAVILSLPDIELPAGVSRVSSDNPRRALAVAAARFYGIQPKTIAAVTGTNGKTSVATFVRQIWTQCGHRAANLGTLGAIGPDGRRLDEGAPLTTPDPVGMAALLSNLAGQGFQHIALEASSHGLDQCRLDGVKVAAAGFTNLTRDHLDYHGTEKSYFAAKIRLFTEVLVPGGIAIVNADSPKADAVAAAARDAGREVWRVGALGDKVRLIDTIANTHGQALKIEVDGRSFNIALPLAGAFQTSNALVAAGLAIACGERAETVFQALERLEGAPGRLERVATVPCGAAVYVDYAHTPDALETVINALRPHTAGKLVMVFGCGGDRDVGKRPQMGEIAARFADVSIVTDDNPRSEDPADIRRQILDGVVHGAKVFEIGDRRAAIAAGLEQLSFGDTLLVAGKGHESGQIVGSAVLPFNDRDVVRSLLSAMDTVHG